MSDTSSDKDLHPTVTLLPWYVSGALNKTEREEVDRHLDGCQECRQELENMSQLKEGVHSHYSSQLPNPSSQIFDRVKAQILEEEASLQQQPEKHSIQMEWSEWGTWLEEGLRSLFIPRWAPSLAVVLLVAQGTLLFWSMTPQPGGISPTSDPLFMERSGTEAVPVSKGILVQIAFQENVTEKKLRSVIRDLEARIVNGPSIEGVYIVELLEKNPNIADQKLQAVLSKTSAIRLLKRINP